MRLYSYRMIKSPTPMFTFVSCKQTKSGWWEGMFFSYSVTMVTTLWSKQLLYSGKFSLVQIHSFYFRGTKAWCSDHTPTRWWTHPICTCTKEMTLNDEAKQVCATMAYSSFRNYESIKTAGAGENWLVEQKDPALLIWNSSTSECFLQVRWYFVHIVAGWVCFAATYYREDIIFAADEL